MQKIRTLLALGLLLPSLASALDIKRSCRAYFGQLSSRDAKTVSYSERPEEFLALLSNEVDPQRELSGLQNRSLKTQYGEFFGANEINYVFDKIQKWGLNEGFTPEQKDFLARYVVLRAHGLENDRPALIERKLKEAGIVLTNKGRDVTVEALDLAIAEAGSLEVSQRVRVYPRALTDKASNLSIPQATVVFHGTIEGKEADLNLGKIESNRQRVEELRRSGEGTLLIGDLHLFRSETENRAYDALLRELKRSPPKKIVLGGDVIDSPGVERKTLPKLAQELAAGAALPQPLQEELQRLAARLANREDLPEILREPEVHLKKGSNPPEFTTESMAKLRFALTVVELKKLKEALPNTEIEFLVGNHDVPRREFLTRGDKGSVEYQSQGKNVTLKLPFILPLERGELKKDVLVKALADANPGLTTAQVEAQAKSWFPQIKTIFDIKGSGLDTLDDHRHYDLAFASWFTQRGRDFGVTTLITDPSTPVQRGENLYVHEPILITKDKDITPNLLRVIAPSDNPYGVQPTLNEFTRRVVNFDQHVSAIIERDNPNGMGFANILVGAFSASNTNPGQRYSASLIDPKTGDVLPVTFFDSAKYFEDPESLGVSPYALAPTTRINYELPKKLPKRA